MEAGASSITDKRYFRDIELRWSPTIRGLILILFCLWLALGPAAQSQDIVGAYIAAAFAALLIPLALISYWIGSALKQSFSVRISAAPLSADEGGHIAGNTPFRLSAVTAPTKLWPLFNIRIEPEFERPGAPQITFTLSGQSRGQTISEASILLPHRGSWTIKRVKVSLSDIFGLSRFFFDADNGRSTVEVYPPLIPSPDLPVITSSTRDGDMLSDQNERSGDPMDLKPYHPSDGMRRIIWKIYAKSGELIARHPERAVSPEGRVSIFVLADKNDDKSAGASVSYARTLVELGLEVLCGVEGGRRQAIATSAEQLSRELVDAVWNSGLSAEDAAASAIGFASALQDKLGASKIDSIIITASARRASANKEALKSIGEALSSLGIKPVFVLFRESKTEELDKPRGKLMDLATKIFLKKEALKEETRTEAPNGFLLICRTKGWEAIISDI